jgi:hypothetical protein
MASGNVVSPELGVIVGDVNALDFHFGTSLELGT